jgi:tetratricopeptide (TPR) repeat protein
VLTNLIKHTGYREEKDIVVPEVPASGARLTDPIPFSDAQPAKDPQAPFTIGGLKFTPEIGSELNLVAGQSLKFFYQLWTTPGAANGKKFTVDYTFGRLAASGESKTIHDDFTGEQFDGFGSLVNGKVIPLKELPMGNYRLSMTLAEDGVAQKNFASLSFRLTNTSNASNQSWDILDDAIADDINKGTVDYQRSLCYLASGDTEHGVALLRQAETKKPGDEMVRQRLVGLYFARKSYAEIAALYSRGGITDKTDSQTILQIAESLNQLGNTKKAIETLESAIQLRQDSAPIYLTLASYYQRMGDQQKASDMERKGKSLMSNAHPTT